MAILAELSQALFVGDVVVDAVDRRLQTVSARDHYDRHSGVEQLGLVAGPLDPQVEREVAGADGESAHPAGTASRYLPCIDDALGRLEDRLDVDRTDGHATLGLQPRQQAVDGGQFVRLLRLG